MLRVNIARMKCQACAIAGIPLIDLLTKILSSSKDRKHLTNNSLIDNKQFFSRNYLLQRPDS